LPHSLRAGFTEPLRFREVLCWIGRDRDLLGVFKHVADSIRQPSLIRRDSILIKKAGFAGIEAL
jgi:hypothetical protein